MVADRKEAEVDLRWGARQHRGLSTRPYSQFSCGGPRSGRTALRHLGPDISTWPDPDLRLLMAVVRDMRAHHGYLALEGDDRKLLVYPLYEDIWSL
jgi:hypothetical protein